MSINKKLTLSLALVVVGFCLVLLLVLQGVVMRSFETLELEEADKDVNRVAQAIDAELQHLDVLCGDWGVWDDAYNFVAGLKPEFAKENLYDGVLKTINLNLVYIVDGDGRVVFQSRAAPEGSELIELVEFPLEMLPKGSTLNHQAGSSTSVKGLIQTAWGPMLVSSQPVMKNNRVGPTLGAFVMGRVIDAKLVQHFREETHVEFTLNAPDAARSEQIPTKGPRSTDGESVQHDVVDNDLMRCSTVLRDIDGRPAKVIEAAVPRSITQMGRDSVLASLVSALSAALILLVVLYFMLQRTVIGPLSRFTNNALKVGARADIVKELDLTRGDEIGLLSVRFAEMLEQIEAFQKRLSESAHKAGMSEVATNVLHNVGNMLNGVSVSSSVLRERVSEMPVEQLSKISGVVTAKGPELGRWVSDDPAGRRLPELLGLMATRLSASKSAAAEECDFLTSRVAQVVALIKTQQDIAGGSGHAERLDLAEQVEAALRVVAPEQANVTVQLSLDGIAPLMCDRHKLLQVLVNLIKNAVEACASTDRADRCMRISARIRADRVEIEIADNGSGIAPEVLPRIFQHGFTTKTNGHGFGLHSVANALAEMKGSLRAESAGAGQGATIILELPVEGSATTRPAETHEPRSLARSVDSQSSPASQTVGAGPTHTRGAA